MPFKKGLLAVDKPKPSPEMNTDRMNSWKEIALYLNKDIATCVRWEKKYGLPVYRIQPNSNKSPVFSSKREIEEWFENRARGMRDLRRG